MSTFTYNKQAIACAYKGQWFDSLLELRYILSIEDNYVELAILYMNW